VTGLTTGLPRPAALPGTGLDGPWAVVAAVRAGAAGVGRRASWHGREHHGVVVSAAVHLGTSSRLVNPSDPA
jgi:hypothetical protein